ncbi:Mpr [Nostocoides japonicum T1-X7]|uniref:Mpr n=1 Tax=Nostocoides japonicum T1-X7 TaxID=1194083 RepID=A0A077M2P6_9MICO|nr:DUF4352 domain-containing protein [Tetrasphaera japonica]CCH80081.1 Mpr [Tetrasphaera japonica T1-X7]
MYKRAWFLVVAGVVAIVVLVQVFSSLGGSGSTNADAQGASSSTTTAPKAKKKAASPEPVDRATTSSPSKKGPGVGDKARDGKFEFVVRSVKCGIKEVGDQYLGKKAQGQFCAVNLSVKNIGDAPQSMFADNQYAFDAKGRKFSADAEASMYDNQSQVLWEEINPGNSVKGKVYFDIPKGATLVKLELHDSMFSGGVKVTL